MSLPANNAISIRKLQGIQDRNAFLLVILVFYLCLFGAWVSAGSFPLSYGTDYLAFWSIGRIATEQGYARIYDLTALETVQTRALSDMGIVDTHFQMNPFPVPILAIFVPFFQLLAFLPAWISYWVWALLNLALLIAYLAFFIRKLLPDTSVKARWVGLLMLFLLAYPVFDNFVEGQVEVLLLVFAGEFLRNSIDRKPLKAGLWLAGLLIKPQVLILVLPVLLIRKEWKVLLGFCLSALIIMSSSASLTGFSGLKAMANLWLRFSAGIATSSPERMINWRMLGANLNILTHSSLGWILTGLGILLTLGGTAWLVMRTRRAASPDWTLGMLGVFSATLAVTWHSHYHMAMILIPFMVYTSIHSLMQDRIPFAWTAVTPLAWIAMAMIGLILLALNSINILPWQGPGIALSGFVLNLMILWSVIHNIQRTISLSGKSL